ncbi:MAG: zinc ribbon domain-containing protein [Pseudomonadota bacterium]
MPIFEFRCLGCGNIFEKLFISSDEKVDLECPECKETSFERVVSRASYLMGAGPGGNRPKVTEKSCAPGSRCMTMDIPGPTK